MRMATRSGVRTAQTAQGLEISPKGPFRVTDECSDESSVMTPIEVVPPTGSRDSTRHRSPHRRARVHGGGERGATIVEFALILPILLMLVMGIIELAIAFNRQQGLHAAAREGAREGSIPTSSQSDISDRVNAALVGVPLDSAVTITISPNVTLPCDSSDAVIVVVQATETVSIPFWGTQSYDLTGRGEFKCEN